jgi:hypothetical protein
MSNEVFNQHIEFGSPLEGEGLFEIADWSGEMLKTARRLLLAARPPSDATDDVANVEWLYDRERWANGDPR